MMTIPKDPPVYHGELVVTCTACGEQRDHPPFESNIVLGGQTALFCPTCEEVLPHFIGIKERPKQAVERKRKVRS